MEQRELRDLENQCIQEHAPPCTAACPIHVDVRGMLAQIAQGDFPAALAILTKKLPFPGIIGRVCDHPCQAVCNRKDVGESLSIAALERACAEFGGPPAKVRVLRARGKRVAVVGGGLSGLTAAFDLTRKGYEVALFEAADRLGGSLWDFPESRLPRDILVAETGVVETLGAAIHLNTLVDGAEALEALVDAFDVVYLGVGACAPTLFDLDLDAEGHLQVDPVTFATSQTGVFAGGGVLRDANARSPIHAISEGRRAAISVDRYLQKVSLAASRDHEGPYTTRLYTSMGGIPPLPVVPMADPGLGYRQDEAVAEARRCLQCECMECVKVCEYLAHFGGYPKKYLRQIYNNLAIVKGTRQANTLINSCSLCGLCAEVCPEGLNMADVCREARQVMVQQGHMPPSAHDFALRDMLFSNGDKFTLARHQPGMATSEVLFFPGCQLCASAPEQVRQTYAYLCEKLSGGVGLMLRCCGAPAEWAGRMDLFEEALADFKKTYQEMGSPKLILACSSCYRTFKTYLPEVPLLSLWELFDTLGLPDGVPTVRQDAPVLAVHDPCTTRHEPQIHESVRNLVRRLGYMIEELPLNREQTECCSYGGLMWLANPDLARDVVRRRIEASSTDYVTYCAMCRDFFAGQGKRTFHLLDLIFPSSGEDARSGDVRRGPGYSQRHENRARLKRHVLQELWGESVAEKVGYEKIKLVFADAVQARLDRRLILVEDIQQVIAFAESTGKKLLNRESGHFVAYHKPTSVTYWVEYSSDGDTFVVHNAYSHRMEIVEEGTA